ncbi:MAG: hypothetical protein ABJA94_02475 [Rhodoglobus sp.]
MSPPIVERAGDSGARVGWIVLAILTLIFGFGFMLMPLLIWVFGAPVYPLPALAIAAGFAIVGIPLCVIGVRWSRQRMLRGLRSWWVAALSVVALVLLWVICARLLAVFAAFG